VRGLAGRLSAFLFGSKETNQRNAATAFLHLKSNVLIVELNGQLIVGAFKIKRHTFLS